MKDTQIKANSVFVNFLRVTLGKYLLNKFNVEIGVNDLSNLKPPYLILANHTSFWDPFLVNIFVNEPIHFVTSDEYFRNIFVKNFLKLTGAIPKTKFKSDFATVKDIIRIKRKSGIIGIFPEGMRNWDGKTVDILYPTAKLVKTLKIPVVISLLKGAYLSYPRWAKKPRKGKVTISYKIILNTSDITKLDVNQIHKKITENLIYDEYSYQQEHMIPYIGSKLAENLELFLFICPHCKRIGSLNSKNNTFFCNHCNYSVCYNEFGFFDSMSKELYFENPRDWNVWQQKYLQSIITNCEQSNCKQVIMLDEIVLYKGGKLRPLKKCKPGNISLKFDSFEFIDNGNNKISFNVEKIKGLNVQSNNKFEFYYDNELYRFNFKVPNTSAYKWVKGLQILIRSKKQKETFLIV